jgi:CRP-like cAMP-binding protein
MKLPYGLEIIENCVGSGKVKRSTISREGKILILYMASPGEVLGLSAVISNRCYEVTATTAAAASTSYTPMHS